LRLADQIGVSLDLWRLQNLFWELQNETGANSETGGPLINELADRLKFSEQIV